MGPVVVMGHVAHRIQMDERRDGGHDDQHDRGQPVQADRPFGAEIAGHDPVHDGDMLRLAVEAQEYDP